MKKRNINFIIIIFLILSCKKEISHESTNRGSFTVHPTDSLLVKIVERSGSDSIVTRYGYDAFQKLVSIDYQQTVSSISFQEHYGFIRNAAGIVTQKVYKNDSLISRGIDSILYQVHYNASTAQYISQSGKISKNGQTIKDSISYTYSGSKIVQSEEFLNLGLGDFGFVKNIFGYDGTGNISNIKIYTPDSSATYQFTSENTFLYDLNVNPLKLSLESFLFNDPTAFSNYNVTSAVFKDVLDPTNTLGYSVAYAYNTVNKPISGTRIYNNGPNSQTISYYYQ